MITYIEKFYPDAEKLSTVIGQMEYTAATFGDELSNFNHVMSGTLEQFESIVPSLRGKVALGPNSGLYRKPYNFVHFENFDQNTLFVALVAIEKTTFKVHNHKEKNVTKIIDVTDDLNTFIKDECMNSSKWDAKLTYVMEPGDMVLFNPWFLHSVSGNLVKLFYINLNVQQANPTEEIAENIEETTPAPQEEENESA